MPGHFRRVEVWSDLQCAGGTRLAVLRDPIALEPVYDIAGDESLKLRLSRAAASYTKLTERCALRIVRRAAGVEVWEEWRVSGRGESSGFTSPPSDFTGRPVRFDLGDVILRRTLNDGTTAFSFSFTGLTLAEAFDAYLAPALVAAGLGYWGRGTFDASAPFDDTVTDGTVLSVLRAWCDRFGLELAERPNGTTGYLIDLLDERGVSAPVPRVETRKNLELAKRTVTTNEQATRVIPRGGAAGSEKVGIGAIRWKVAGVDSFTNELTLVDELGIVTPIAFDDQLNGWLVFRELTGATFPIISTTAATQKVGLSSVGTFSTGELISLRVSDPNTNTLNWRPMVAGVAPLLYVTAVDVPGLRTTLANSVPSVGGAGAFIAVDGDMVDWTAVYCPLVLLSQGSAIANVAGYYQVDAAIDPVADLSLVQVGDIVWIDADSSPTAPFSVAPAYPIGTVTAVDAVLNRLTIENRYDPLTPAIASNSVAGYTLRVYRPTYSRLVALSIAASNEVQLASVASLAVDQMVEVRQTAGGVLPIALEAPAELQALTATPAGYGVIERFVDAPTVRGETNLIPNPFMRAWAGSTTTAPDQWTLAGGASILQETDPQLTTLGGKSGLVDFGSSGSFLTPPFRVWRIGTTTRTTVSLRVKLRFATFSGACGLAFSIANVAGTPATRVLRTLYPTDHPTAADTDKFETDVWYDLIITAINLSALDLNQPLQLLLTMVGASGVCTAYVDAAQVTQTEYDPGAFLEGSGATELWNLANRYLEESRTPLVEYAVQLRDLSRLDGSPWIGDAIAIGGRMQVVDRDLGINSRPRVVQYAPNDLDPLSSRVVLSNRRKTLSRLLSALANRADNGAGQRSSTQATPSTAVTTPPDTGGGGSSGTGVTVLHVPLFAPTSPADPLDLVNIADAPADLDATLQKPILLSQMLSGRLTAYITLAALVGATQIELLYSLDRGVTFVPLPTPMIMTLTISGPVVGDWFALPTAMQTDVVIGARVLGGGGTADVSFASLAAQFSDQLRTGGGTPLDTTVASVALAPAPYTLDAPVTPIACNSALLGPPGLGLTTPFATTEYYGENFCRFAVGDGDDAQADFDAKYAAVDYNGYAYGFAFTDVDVEDDGLPRQWTIGEGTNFNGGHKYIEQFYPAGYAYGDPKKSWYIDVWQNWGPQPDGMGDFAQTFWRNNAAADADPSSYGPYKATARLVVEFSNGFVMDDYAYYTLIYQGSLNGAGGIGMGAVEAQLSLTIQTRNSDPAAAPYDDGLQRLWLNTDGVNGGAPIHLGLASALLFDGVAHELVLICDRNGATDGSVRVDVTLDGAVLYSGTLTRAGGGTGDMYFPESVEFMENSGPLLNPASDPLSADQWIRVYEPEYHTQGMPSVGLGG